MRFSVIMPVYKVEKYLSAAIDSVLNQTFSDFELILVDDCSPDGCPAICDEYAQKDKRVSVIHHKENQGLSAARNTGLKFIKGEYVTFMDSDDYIDLDLLEKVAVSLNENSADCIVFGIKEEYCDKNGIISKTFDLTFGQEKRINNIDELHKIVIELEEKTFLGYAWNKFYKASHIKKNNLSFEKVTLIEDIAFNIRFFEEISSLNILNIAPYHYMKRIDGSLTNKFVKDYYILHRRRVFELLALYKKWNACDIKVKNILANIYARYIYSALQRNCDKRSKMNHSDRIAFLKSIYADELFIELSQYINMGGYAGLIYGTLKRRDISLSLFFGRIIYIIKEKLPILFAAAKQKR